MGLSRRGIRRFQIMFVCLSLYFLYHLVGRVPHLRSPEDEGLQEQKDWAMFVTKHQKRITSQGRQDGTLEYIFSKIGTTNKFFVEFGFDGNAFNEGKGPNTEQLYLKGWKGLLLDGGHENKAINLHKAWIKPETIVQVLKDKGVPNEADYISVDIDSADCFVAREIACNMKPRVMTVEYNSNFPLEATLANMGRDYHWTDKLDRIYGCSLGVHILIAEECGYSIVDVIPRLDVVLVRKDLLVNTRVPSNEHWRPFTEIPLHFPTRVNDISKFMCEWRTWMKTHDYESCSGEPVKKQVEELNINLWRGWYNPFGWPFTYS